MKYSQKDKIYNFGVFVDLWFLLAFGNILSPSDWHSSVI